VAVDEGVRRGGGADVRNEESPTALAWASGFETLLAFVQRAEIIR
jgi:hypothetical protein